MYFIIIINSYSSLFKFFFSVKGKACQQARRLLKSNLNISGLGQTLCGGNRSGTRHRLCGDVEDRDH